ncbi:MAG: T9SS type A sorting domain-containing protein [Ignavibacteriaceae bacterium]|nr:T9SS type A sorting domain-containing protein [Ignavibacteriaceae bacterium]
MKLFSLLFLFFFAASMTFAQMDLAPKDPIGGETPGGITYDTIPPVGFPFPTVFNFNYSLVPGVNAGSVGAMYFNGKYYLNRWNSTMMYRYNANGPNGAPGTFADSMTYQGSCRDLATDGMYLYGGNASTALYRIDPNTMATLKTFTLAGGSTRAVAWDPNRMGFWNTNFGGNIFLHDTNGVLKTQITSTLAGKYGMAFDSLPGQPAFLWVWNQVTGGLTASLHKINIATGLEVANYVFTLTAASIGIPGGAEICWVNNNRYLLLNYQNFALAGYLMEGIIPVEFTAFSAKTVGGDVVLDWSTATEKNNRGFEIQRKSGNGEYIVVGFIPGNGTSLTPRNYSFVDKNVQTGYYSYRLRQMDYDGSYAHSAVVEVDVMAPVQFSLDQNYPNPFNPATTISFSLAVDSKVSMKVYDVLGKEVMTLAGSEFSAGTHNLSFNASGLTSGVYVYKIEASGVDGTNFSSMKKMILNK